MASSGGGARGRDVAQFAKAAGGSEFPGQGSALIVQKWAPSRSTKRDAAPLSTSAAGPQHHEAIFRKVRGILNKLTPEKFDKLCLELLNVGIDSKFILKGIILLIFEKALEEPKYSSLYAQLCLRLAEDAPNFDGPPLEGTERHKQTSSFRKLLIAKLQDEFENRSKKLEVFESHEGPLSAEDEEQRTIAKLKMLGNIKFIGELGKLELLHESILHRCIKTLLDKKKRVALKEIGEDLECLCQILRTVGPQLDHDKARLLMDQYFERMRALMINKELPSRIRFLLQDTVELRENAWQPRKAFSDNGPKLISQIRQDAVKDLGVYIPSPYSSSNHRSDLFPDDPFLLWGGAMGGMARRPQYSLGGLSDVFSQMGRELGTGPGVIQSRYSPPMGRHRTGQLFNGYGSHMTAGPAQFGDKGFSRQLGPGLFNLPGPPIPGSGKELPSRFGKKGALNLDEISLRPAQSFLLSRNQTSKLQPQMPTMMPPSAQPPPTQMPPSQAPSLGLKSAPPPIQEKPPKKEKKVPTREELLKMTDGLIEELYGEGSVEAATTGLKELPAPRPLLPELLAHILASSLERPDEERERACVLLETLQKDEVINGELFVKAFSALLDRCGELESTVPQVKSCAAQLAARAVASGLVGLAEVAGPLKNGQHFPLLLLCLQQLARLRDPDWLADTFQASRINMTKMLPECDQSAERMVEILEEKGLAFLFPLLHVERELSRHLQSDPSPPAFYKWVKENVSARLHGDRAFINILVTCLLHFITGETSLADGFDPTVAPNRDVMEREKQLLDSFQPVLCRFLHGRVPLQLSALYALQVHCHQHCFPKGMLLRWFIALYDLEVVEEEAFLAWKEDLAQEFPGKGKALFQVNQWLTWLETAEEDESEEEDDDAD